MIEKREIIQKKIDNWHKSNKENDLIKTDYTNFLKSIGYIVEEENNFKIETDGVDEEISSIAGPQLVVPVDNARYALNAANSRWGSLYDALYGTDVVPGKVSKEWDKNRALKVISFVREFLDESFPLSKIKWKDVSKIQIEGEKLVLIYGSNKDYLKNSHFYL